METPEEFTADYLRPWTTGDTRGQEARGEADGLRDAREGRGYPDGCELDTPYNRGYLRARRREEEEGQRRDG